MNTKGNKYSLRKAWECRIFGDEAVEAVTILMASLYKELIY